MNEPSARSPSAAWSALGFYEKFEQLVIWTLTGVIGLVVLAALWNLTTRVVLDLVLSGSFDPTDHATFQTIFGMIFTVIIAMEFKRSILVAAERRESVVQVRVVILLAMLAIVRKLIIIDLAETSAEKLLGLAAAVLALGIVYWLVRDQDRRDRLEREAA